MKRNTEDERRWKLLQLLARSAAAKEIIGKRPQIENALRATRRRVWPLATVARLFGISASLLRKWAKEGLVSLFRRPSAHHRPGLTEKAVRRFLKELAEEAESGTEVFPHRPRHAEERCRKATQELKPGEVLAPAEFAARARVAVTTVRRLLAIGELDAWYPTPHRPNICDWMEKERRKRKKHLTRKKARGGR